MADHERRGVGSDLRTLSRADNPLVRAVSRLPVRVGTKLLVAFAVIAGLLLAIALLGVRVLGQSNSRVVALGTLQQRAATYQRLQTQASQLRQLLAVRAAEDPSLQKYLGGGPAELLRGLSWTLVDKAIAASLSQLGPATNEARFGFVPPRADELLLQRIRRDYARLSRSVQQIIAADRAGTTITKSQPFLTATIDEDNDLGATTDQLASRTRALTDALIAQNRSSYVTSRNVFIGVGLASVLLAVVLGIVISSSIVGPIRRADARLAEIAAGDFSGRLVVSNRDELGALAANLNRMNDELRRLYDELAAASRHKSQFLADMSHELRTPLNAVIGFSEALQEQLFGDLNDHQRRYVGAVVEAGHDLLSLINDILDLSKVEAGRMELDLADVSLRQALYGAASMHAEGVHRAGLVLATELEPDEITIRADERKLRQVLHNLLSNAVKFTPAGGRIEVSARLADAVVEVAVSDTGPGIGPEDQALIFEEFRQAAGKAAVRRDGTGLGLPLSRRFIELHGGRLWVESTPGERTIFRFTLPVNPRG